MTTPVPSPSRLHRLLTLLALGVLLAVAALRLDRSELSPSEGMHAQAALGPLENDRRCVPEHSAWAATHGFWRGWAMVAGTLERNLRLSVMLSLVLAALVCAEVGAALFGAAARPIVYGLWASSPFLNRADLLHPDLFGALGAALLLCGAPFLRGASAWWLLGSVLGGALLASCDVRLAPWALGGVLVIFLAELPRKLPGTVTRGIALYAATAAVIVLVAWRLDALRLLSWRSPEDSGRLVVAWPWHAAILALLVLLVVKASARRAALASAVAVAAATAFALVVKGGSQETWAPALPLLALAGAGAAAYLPRGGRAVAALSLSALALVGLWDRAEPWLGYGADRAGPFVGDPMRATLSEAGTRSAPGGRLVVAGPLRQGLLYYARRGHDPGVPLLLIPEDTSEAGIADLLRHQLRVTPGSEARTPPILVHPPSASPLPGTQPADPPRPHAVGVSHVVLLPAEKP